jgi:hypothetical protein
MWNKMNLKRYAAAVFALTGLAFPATAGNVIKAAYVIEAAGTTVMRANFDATIEKGSFTSSLFGKTAGAAGFFKGMRLEMQTTGGFDGSDFAPGNFEKSKKKRYKDARKTGISWTPTGKVEVMTDSGPAPLSASVGQALSQPSSDPLTAILSLSQMRGSKPCQGKTRVYDGRDVFDLTLRPRDQGAAGAGKPMNCSVAYTPIAGNSFDKGEKDVDNYDAVFAPINLAGQDKPMYFPVRLVGSSMGITYKIRAVSLSVDGANQLSTAE